MDLGFDERGGREAVRQWNGLIAINVDAAIARGVGFADHPNVLQAVRRSGTALDYSNAESALEVLIKPDIPAEVIRWVRRN